MKTKEMKNQTCWILKILFQYTRKSAPSVTLGLEKLSFLVNLPLCYLKQVQELVVPLVILCS